MMRRTKAAFENSQTTLLPYVNVYIKRVTNTDLPCGKNTTTSTRRTTRYEKEQKNFHVDLGKMAK